MEKNHVPKVSKDNPTGCCPRFNPKDWDSKTFVFKDKPFVRVTSCSVFYMPLNLGSVMEKTWKAVTDAKADDKGEFVILSYDMSPWKCEHFLSVKKAVPDMENVKLSGTYMAKVYEGPFQNAPKWIEYMKQYVKEKGRVAEKVYLYYTTCPKCLKTYGNNFVVAMAKVN